ncbi:MAG: primosomal protein N' [Candidatus Aminicenantes bacterium]|jgi:primosomal protein N' (replication factor Y)
MTLYAEVTLSLPVSQTFIYMIPESLRTESLVGSRVLVPLGQRMVTGFVVKLRKKRLDPGIQLKEIAEVLDEKPVFSSAFLSFTRKLSDYYYSSWGEVLQASLPPSFILKTQARVYLTEKASLSMGKERLSREERAFLDFLQKKEYSVPYLKRKLKIQNMSALLSRLESKGLVQIHRDIKRVGQKKAFPVTGVESQLEIDFSLDARSRQVAERIVSAFGQKAFSRFLLQGHAEKRESVYFYLIKKILDEGKKVLFLVPEIALTQSLREKFEKRLGKKVALLHSRLTERRKEVEWMRIKEGKADVVVGPRSALFAPVEDLGLIIVDEEQDESYFQQENPSYDARKGALLRAKQEKAGLVYGSELPSVSAFYRARNKGYLLCLEGEKKEKRIEVIDDRREKVIISRKLEERIAIRLKKKERILIFLNRRGYAPYLLCSNCHFIPRCVRCDIALAYHKKEEKLVCHYCDFSTPVVETCPDCRSRVIKTRGVGIEAVEEGLKWKFPQARTASFATDLNRKEQEKIIQEFRRGKIDILVGTQLLVHQVGLPPASLVAILYPETVLTLSDYRAGQKAFQAVSQMMRFLKKDTDAEVIIQTALPDHFSIRQAASEDYMSFYKEELNFRRLMKYPPFSHLVEILFQGVSLRSVARQSRDFLSRVKEASPGIEVLGPALAPLSKLRGKSRVQVILKAQRKKELDRILKRLLKSVRARKSILVHDS